MKDTKKKLKNKFLTIGIFMAFVMALCACESKDEPTPNGEAEQQATETAAPAKTTETPASKQTDTPIPTVTPTVAPTATLIPTETPVPKVIPTYTPTPIPTATPTATPTSTPIPTPTPTPEPEQTEIEYINYPVWVAVNGAKMYKEWDTESEQLAELKKGTKLRATRYQIGGWYFVLNGNILGWIEESNVVETDPNK